VKDVFKVQDDIAGSIADALKLRLGTPAAQVASTSRGTENLVAYDHYLRALFFWNRRGADNLNRAINYFEQAIAADPNYGRAYAGIASAYALLPEYTESPPADVLQRTKNAAERALAIDSGLAEAHTALGLASVHAWDWANAESQYRMALASDPRYATAHQWYGELMYHTGRVDSAIAHAHQAVALDPLAPAPASALTYALSLAGRCDESIPAQKKGIEFAPALSLLHETLGVCYLSERRFQEAAAEMEIAARLSPGLAIHRGELAYAYGMAGQKDRARLIAAELSQRVRTEPRSSFALAMAELGVGDHDAALTSLERAVGQHDVGLTQFSIILDPKWRPLHSSPRFMRILQQMNLAEYTSRLPDQY
jgi:tetratricopeptide (TPR) repeat protein